MRVNRKQKTLLILLIWLFASLSGMHGHYCFDGQEPPVSVHFDLMGSHDHADTDEDPRDFDSKSMSVTILKLLSLNLLFIAAALLLLIIWPVVRGQNSPYFNSPSTWLTVTGLRPPLRAPPAYSH